MPESESGALPLGDTQQIGFEFAEHIRHIQNLRGYDGIRTCDPIIMSDVL